MFNSIVFEILFALNLLLHEKSIVAQLNYLVSIVIFGLVKSLLGSNTCFLWGWFWSNTLRWCFNFSFSWLTKCYHEVSMRHGFFFLIMKGKHRCNESHISLMLLTHSNLIPWFYYYSKLFPLTDCLVAIQYNEYLW